MQTPPRDPSFSPLQETPRTTASTSQTKTRRYAKRQPVVELPPDETARLSPEGLKKYKKRIADKKRRERLKKEEQQARMPITQHAPPVQQPPAMSAYHSPQEHPDPFSTVCNHPHFVSTQAGPPRPTDNLRLCGIIPTLLKRFESQHPGALRVFLDISQHRYFQFVRTFNADSLHQSLFIARSGNHIIVSHLPLLSFHLVLFCLKL